MRADAPRNSGGEHRETPITRPTTPFLFSGVVGRVGRQETSRNRQARGRGRFGLSITLRTRESAGGPGGLGVPWLGVAPCGRATGASRACWRWGHPPPRRRPNRVPGANGPQRVVFDAEQDVVTPALVVALSGPILFLFFPQPGSSMSNRSTSPACSSSRSDATTVFTFGETVLTKDFREEDLSGVPRTVRRRR